VRLPADTVGAMLTDGTEVEFRPIGPDDKALLERGMAKLSPASRRLRFMSSIDNLSRSQLAYLTEIDHQTHLAWGALVAGEPVAVARLIRRSDASASAEIAITVVDDWQRRGVGELLIRLMAEIARSLGVERFDFEALAENEGILRLLGGLGAVHALSEGVVSGSLAVAGIEPAMFTSGNLLELAESARHPNREKKRDGQPARARIKRRMNSA
jgi:GNAT superfamily N-acetyltransferase